MERTKEPLMIGADTVANDLDVSKSKAYDIIRKLNQELLEKNPQAIVIAGKVNRLWYEACLYSEDRRE